MLHTVIPMGVIFPEGDYPCEQSEWSNQPTAEWVASPPIPTDLKKHIKKQGE